MPYIYKITNVINNKCYIGKTIDSIEKRWKEHCHDYQKNDIGNRPLYLAMRKYGVENFSIEEVESCDISILNEREIYWINFFDSYKTGYNATKGGDGTAYVDRDLILKLYTEYKLIKQVAILTGYDVGTIAAVLESQGIDKETRKQNAHLTISKPVAKYDLTTGHIIAIYPSIAEAERQNGKTYHIYDVCRGRRQSCKGYGWKYI